MFSLWKQCGEGFFFFVCVFYCLLHFLPSLLSFLFIFSCSLSFCLSSFIPLFLLPSLPSFIRSFLLPFIFSFSLSEKTQVIIFIALVQRAKKGIVDHIYHTFSEIKLKQFAQNMSCSVYFAPVSKSSPVLLQLRIRVYKNTLCSYRVCLSWKPLGKS